MKHRKILSALLALVMVMALAVPAFAASVDTVMYESDDFGGDDWYYIVHLELDRDPVATALPWTSTHDLEWSSVPTIYVPAGTTIQSCSRGLSETYPYGSEALRTDKGGAFMFTPAGGTELGEDETVALFDGKVTPTAGLINSFVVDFPFALTQPGEYSFWSDMVIYAKVRAINPGDPYDVTVLAEENGRDAKINACQVTAQSTVSYQGKDIPLYTVLPGSEDASNLYLKQADGAAYVVNVYTAKNSSGTLTDIEADNTYEFTGQDGYVYRWWLENDDDDMIVFEIAENGTTIQTVVLACSAASAQPAAPAAGTYTAKRYDTWGQIALNNYGTYGVWKQLMKANGNKAVKADMVITLPEKIGSYTRLPAQVLAEGEQFYTVKAGDTLGQIAAATYKDINMYKAIFERNKDRLKNANSIYEGQIIILPVKPAK